MVGSANGLQSSRVFRATTNLSLHAGMFHLGGRRRRDDDDPPSLPLKSKDLWSKECNNGILEQTECEGARSTTSAPCLHKFSLGAEKGSYSILHTCDSMRIIASIINANVKPHCSADGKGKGHMGSMRKKRDELNKKANETHVIFVPDHEVLMSS